MARKSPSHSLSPSPSRSPSPKKKRHSCSSSRRSTSPDRVRSSHRDRDKRDNRDRYSDRDRDRDRDRDIDRHSGRTLRHRDDKDNSHKKKSSPTRHSDRDGDKSRERDRSRDRDRGGARSNEEVKAREPPAANRDVDVESDALEKMEAAEQALEAKNKQKPSFELSGKLAEETNRVRGVTLLFSEPPDARKPDTRWRLYVFKGGEVLNEPLYVHRQSCYLFGRERRIADIPTDHPSCSKQHAVLQFRQVEKEGSDGMMSKQTRPYLMDLGSTNKTFINDVPMEPQRYYELKEKDTLKFGNSSREYVLLHENSAG